MYKKILLMLIISILLLSCSNRKVIENKDYIKNTAHDAPLPSPVMIHYPMTTEYFNGIMSSSNEFSNIFIMYKMNENEEYPEAKRQYLDLRSKAEYSDEYHFANQKVEEIEKYDSYLTIYNAHLQEDLKYKCELESEMVFRILEFFQQNPNYYFNAEEYDGQESRQMSIERQFGHINFIAFKILPPDRMLFDPFVFKTFCKGWDPGEAPPEELMPVIDYLENTIIPIMLQHPEP